MRHRQLVLQQGDDPNSMQEMATPQCSDRKLCDSVFIDLLPSFIDIVIVSPELQNTHKIQREWVHLRGW